MKAYRMVNGNISVKLLRRLEGDICHFFTLSEWESYQSINTFVGDDFEKVKYYPKDAKYLLELEENVKHYETFDY